MGKRARNGQGSVYETTFVDKRTGKTIKRWQAQVVIPQELGKPKRKTLYEELRRRKRKTGRLDAPGGRRYS